MNSPPHGKVTFPALRGRMGDWRYYICLMSLPQLGARVRFADEIHKSTGLSDMIQRQLQQSQAGRIAVYLKTQPERFFNSLVIATYGGEPTWHALVDVRSRIDHSNAPALTDEAVSSIGFLTLTGKERLFALDGQHRLAGIKEAVANESSVAVHDEVSVILVAHESTTRGLQRSRRLFTTLNKTARAVSKGEIISLDEDDVMAICVRRLIEQTSLFGGKRVAFVANNNIPVADDVCLTTIGNLYDLLAILFTASDFDLRRPRPALQRARPTESDLTRYFEYAHQFFQLLGSTFDELGEFFAASNTQTIVRRYRNRRGGSALFRPIGLDVFTRIVCSMTRMMDVKEAVALAGQLPRSLDKAPFRRLMWDPHGGTILNGHRVTLRETLGYMAGMTPKFPTDELLERYRRETGSDDAQLPPKVV